MRTTGQERRYRLTIHWSRSPEDDIDPFDEGADERLFPTVTEALAAFADGIPSGQAGYWDAVDQYELQSCWLRDDEPSVEISYGAVLFREVEERRDDRHWRTMRTAIPMTPLRLRLATGLRIGVSES